MGSPGHDKSLLDGLLAGSPWAVESLQKHLRSALHGVSTGVDDLVEDSVGEIFEAARKGAIEDDARLIVRSREILRNNVRRQRRSSAQAMPPDWLDRLSGPAGETMEDRLRWWELLDRIAAAFNDMERVLFYLLYEYRAEPSRISVWLEISPDSLRKRKQRLLRKVRRVLRDERNREQGGRRGRG